MLPGLRSPQRNVPRWTGQVQANPDDPRGPRQSSIVAATCTHLITGEILTFTGQQAVIDSLLRDRRERVRPCHQRVQDPTIAPSWQGWDAPVPSIRFPIIGGGRTELTNELIHLGSNLRPLVGSIVWKHLPLPSTQERDDDLTSVQLHISLGLHLLFIVFFFRSSAFVKRALRRTIGGQTLTRTMKRHRD
ncbi:hypothetical protein BDV59DRAFT_189078 [Aspergillus ambiguus]|uniref:uncharacterized protein n=1 Tax=Aspergillus ambiguus TaxID=176160 RepID=UPI003CCE284F